MSGLRQVRTFAGMLPSWKSISQDRNPVSVNGLATGTNSQIVTYDMAIDVNLRDHLAVRLRDISRDETAGDNGRNLAISRSAALLTNIMGAQMVDAIASLNRGPSARPVLIRGVPIAANEDTVPDAVNNLIVAGLLEAASQFVFTYQEQKDGALVQDIVPITGQESANSSGGRVALGWHTDDAIFCRPYRAEGIALLGIVNEYRCPTYYADVPQIVDRLDRDILAILREPRFRFALPESFNVYDHKVIYSEPRPILTAGCGWDEMSCAEYSTTAVHGDGEAKSALQELRRTLSTEPGVRIVLGPGDMLVFSNVRGIHSRGKVGGKRHLKRAYFRTDLGQLRALTKDCGGRVFSCESFILLSAG
jgi:alpha-ketoglutarate-dependent taurine dioxygenase